MRYGEEYFMEIPANKNGGRTNDHRDVVSMRGGHAVNGGHKGGHSDKGSYTQEDAAYFRKLIHSTYLYITKLIGGID